MPRDNIVQLHRPFHFVGTAHTSARETGEAARVIPASSVTYDPLVQGLKWEVRNRGFRCSQCNRMQRAGTVLVWVPNGVLKGDPRWSIEERTRDLELTGHASASAWCFKCAPKRECVGDPLGDEQPDAIHWPSFFGGIILGLAGGLLAIAVPAIVLARVVYGVWF